MSTTALEKVKEFFGFKETSEVTLKPPKIEEPKSSLKSSFKGSLVHSQNSRPFTPSEIKIEEPRIYEDSLNISTQLREKKPVIVNLKYLDSDASKRLIDFVCGTAYAINGHMMKIGENIFLFTPPNVLIVNSDEKTTLQQGLEREEKEVFFKKVSGN